MVRWLHSWQSKSMVETLVLSLVGRMAKMKDRKMKKQMAYW